MKTKQKLFFKSFFIRFFVCFSILALIFSAFIFFKQASLKEQCSAIAHNIAFRIHQALKYESEKLIIFEELLLDKGDLILNDMQISDSEEYYRQFWLTAELLHKNTVNQQLQLISINNNAYSYPGTQNPVDENDKKFLAALKTADSKFQNEDIHKIYGAFETSDNGTPLLVLRNPVYYGNGKPWGFAKIELTLSDFLYSMYLNNLINQGFYYTFEYVRNNEKHTALGTAPEYRTQKQVLNIDVYGPNLIFSLIPVKGWVDLNTVLTRFSVIFVVSLLIGYYMTKFTLCMIIIKEKRANEQKAKELIEQAYKDIDQANTAKNLYLSTMSHDIRTPMNAIMGFCTLLKMDYDHKEKVLNYTQKIHTSCQHLMGLINDILDMSKIESGKVSIHESSFSIASLVDEVKMFINPLVNEKKQNFTVEIGKIVHENIIGDNLRLNQILLNLLSNAVKYTPKNGSVLFQVRELPGSSPKSCKMEFTVKDDGIGMSKEFQEKIFEPFAREADGRTDNIQGTGLGMAITKNLVDLLGGTIEFKSELNKGSVFVLTLEFQTEENEEEFNYLKKNNINSILIADDDPAAKAAVENTLQGHGIRLFFASTLEDAKNLADNPETKPDLVLINPKIDGGKGTELAACIKSQKLTVPVFLLIGSGMEQDGHNACAEGIVNGFLPKPFFFTNLIHALKNTFAPKQKQNDSRPLENLNILAAEDNDINIQLIGNLLEKLGASCKICKNGLLACEEFEKSAENQYDVILMDIQMPVMNGLEAAKFIRNCRHPKAKSIPVIAMTANAFSDDIKASLECGMNDHVTKPVNIDLLSAAILKAVKNAKNNN